QSCHRADEKELLGRVDGIQERHHELLQRGGKAIVALIDAVVAAKAGGATDDELKAARDLQRKAQWRLDFVAAENSMGFHAPQETARILALAIDYARQGELSAVKRSVPSVAAPEVPPGAPAASTAAPAGSESPGH
ncbi:MAG: ammonia-forming cytochrome c nitrite reductase subunit c552, partial [Myxococcales bacterium]|nr:ammonia-forming cytochrome c nitrite reductase subunit c552 [Myxococcales bacterium]